MFGRYQKLGGPCCCLLFKNQFDSEMHIFQPISKEVVQTLLFGRKNEGLCKGGCVVNCDTSAALSIFECNWN